MSNDNTKGILIKNISAGSLYSYNNGDRKYWSSTDAVLDDSLFRRFLKDKLKLKIDNQRTKDIICLDFDFGFNPHEDEIKELKSRKKEYQGKGNKDYRDIIQAEIDALEKDNVSKAKMRTEYYENGVNVHYNEILHDTPKKQGKVKRKAEDIHYKMLYRTSSKAKSGQCMFIKDRLYDKAIEYLTMGLSNKIKPEEEADIVGISAYAPLVTSSIVDTIHIPVEDILILKDQDFEFMTKAVVIKNKDKENDNSEKPKQVTEANTVNDYKVKNTIWDGMGLIDEKNLIGHDINGYALLRNHFFKMAGFRTKLQSFFKDYCEEKGYDYDTYECKDMFGVKHKLKEVKVVTTNNACKWIKFKDLLGGEKEAYEYWKEKIKADNSEFGIVKTDHESKFGDVQQQSYQMNNTLPLPVGKEKETIGHMSWYNVDYIMQIKNNHEKFIEFLNINKNFSNHYEMLISLCEHNEKFRYSDYFLREKSKIIHEYVKKVLRGKLINHGDNLTVCGNPYALLLYATNQTWENDPTFECEEGTIQCYTTRFEPCEYLCAFRNPHNSPNNILYLHNVYSEVMKKYFPFSKNIIAINMIGTDAQDRANSMDEDSDFIYVSNQEDLVGCAKTAYKEFPTIVNEIALDPKRYKNTMEAYAEMDNTFANASFDIGESSNLAQIALSYYWTNKNKITLDYVCILSVLAQVAIDGVKRKYHIEVSKEIDRIRAELNIKENGLPEFWNIIKPLKRNKKDTDEKWEKRKQKRKELLDRGSNIVCPMNLLQDSINIGVKKADNSEQIILIDKFFKWISECDANGRQINIINEDIKKYSDKKKAKNIILDDCSVQEAEQYAVDQLEFEEFMNILKKIKLSDKTMNMIIENVFSINHKKNSKIKDKRNMLNMLYRMNKKRFLSNFYTIDEME